MCTASVPKQCPAPHMPAASHARVRTAGSSSAAAPHTTPTLVFAFRFSKMKSQSLRYVTLNRCHSVSTRSPSVVRSLSRAPEYVQPPWALVKTPRPWKSSLLKSPSYLPTQDDASMHRCQRGRQGHGTREKDQESKHCHDRLPHCPVEICHTQAC